MSDAERKAQIRQRLEAATPGPWFYERTVQNRGTFYEVAPKNGDEMDWANEVGCTADDKEADAAFIANAPTDLAWALERLDSLESALQREQANTAALREALEAFNAASKHFSDCEDCGPDLCPRYVDLHGDAIVLMRAALSTDAGKAWLQRMRALEGAAKELLDACDREACYIHASVKAAMDKLHAALTPAAPKEEKTDACPMCGGTHPHLTTNCEKGE